MAERVPWTWPGSSVAFRTPRFRRLPLRPTEYHFTKTLISRLEHVELQWESQNLSQVLENVKRQINGLRAAWTLPQWYIRKVLTAAWLQHTCKAAWWLQLLAWRRTHLSMSSQWPRLSAQGNLAELPPHPHFGTSAADSPSCCLARVATEGSESLLAGAALQWAYPISCD